MEDVIFSGTSNRPSKNISEVTLLLDNFEKSGPSQYKEFDEIFIKEEIEKIKALSTILMIKKLEQEMFKLFLLIFLLVLTSFTD